MTLRDFFNNRKWNTGDLASLSLFVTHRGVPGDVREVLGANVDEVLKYGLLVVTPAALDGTTFVPWHRIRSIRQEGNVLWGNP